MYKTKETVKAELRKLFPIDNEVFGGTFEANGKFYINKQDMSRGEVISTLQKYFDCVGIEDGYLKVHPMTLVFTTFEICDGKPDQNISENYTPDDKPKYG